MKLLSSIGLLIILVFQNPILAIAQEPKEPPKKDKPLYVREAKAVLTGPTNRPVGRTVAIKSGGSIGKDFKFKVSPHVADSFTVKDVNTEELIFLFTPETEGKYCVALAVASGDWVDLVFHEVQVGAAPIPPKPDPPKPDPPKPDPPKPDPPKPAPVDALTKAFQNAYAADIAAGVGVPADKNVLVQIFRAAATKTIYDPAITNPKQVYETTRMANEKLLSTPKALGNLRATIAEYQKSVLKITASTPMTQAVRDEMATVFLKIADTLEKVE